ncbi:MAG: T9SS type A sorting domain-containing protein [Bacteroidetes bacterium]|nr:T9SS type A sorting domain-containing protein [Bacteroidota bacterium]
METELLKKSTGLVLSLFIELLTCSGQNYQWAKSIGGPSNENSMAIALDNEGNIFACGLFEGTIDFDPGPGISNLTSTGFTDIFVLKLDSAGNFLWAKSMGGSSHDIGSSIALDDSANIYITGYFSDTADFDPGPGIFNLTSMGFSDIYVSKLDSSGNFLWARGMGGISYEVGISIGLESTGNIFVAGHFFGTADFDPGPETNNLISLGSADIFILKLNSSGSFIWAKSMGGGAYESVSDMSVDGFGNVHTIGSFSNEIDLDPGVGTSILTAMDADDIFISKLDSSGNYLWAVSIGGFYPDYGTSIAVDNSGNVFATGLFEEAVDFDPGLETFYLVSNGRTTDIFILKLNVDGNFVWAKSIGGNNSDSGASIAVDGSNSLYVTGSFSWTVDFDPGDETSNLISNGLTDIFVLKLDSLGNFVWVKGVGGTSFDGSNNIALDGNGNIYTTGTFREVVDFDPGEGVSDFASEGSTDMYILKLGPAIIAVLENSFETNFTVYPNPTNSIVNIDMGTVNDELNIVIRNQLGQEVLEKSFSGANLLQFNIEGAAGIYFIEISSGNKRATLKVFKE